MKVPWERFGGRTGMAVVVLGFIMIFLGWNGAASSDRVPSQFPYLISGGIAGLALVILGAALIVVQSNREDRAKLLDEIKELRTALDEGGTKSAATNGGRPARSAATGRGAFVAGEVSYHVPTCRLLEGRDALPRVTREEVAERQLAACRVCSPAATR
jgi:uncharacterized membrane protein